jgi:hypothetical protein
MAGLHQRQRRWAGSCSNRIARSNRARHRAAARHMARQRARALAQPAAGLRPLARPHAAGRGIGQEALPALRGGAGAGHLAPSRARPHKRHRLPIAHVVVEHDRGERHPNIAPGHPVIAQSSGDVRHDLGLGIHRRRVGEPNLFQSSRYNCAPALQRPSSQWRDRYGCAQGSGSPDRSRPKVTPSSTA